MRFANRWVALSIAVACVVVAAPAQTLLAQEEDPCDAAYDAGQVLMTVTSDADCKLTVNGKPHGTLTANQEKTVKVPGGDGDGKQVLRCASTKVAGAVAEQEDLISAGCRSYTFEVEQAWHRFTAAKKGFVTDSQTGLSWAQSDNGGDIDWNAAKKLCAEKGGRLPTQEELRLLHIGSSLSTPCGEVPCKMSHLFRLSGRFFWTSSTFEDQAIIIGLAGERPAIQSVKPGTAKDARALCVSGAK